MCPSIRKFSWPVVGAVGLAVALHAQTPQNQQKPTFKTGVSFVNVDVYPSLNGQIVADLKQDEFEVLEDGVPQRIETFEHIVARAPVPEAERAEPRTLADSDAAAADPHNRLFVLFFDTLHTAGYKGATPLGYDPRAIGRALVEFLDRLIGPDDLVGLMRPEMPVTSLSFTRRPSTFADFLLSGAEWQKRFLEGEMDETEKKYDVCYMDYPDIAPAMIARRRELLMVDGLRSLTVHLQNLREGRKAVLVISTGWTLFTPDERLARPLRGKIPGPPPITVTGRGQPGLGSDPREGNVMLSECERDRLMLARINNELDFRQMVEEANRANVSFYPIDPRGLTPESTMNRRSDSLMTLATATDGVPVTNSNDFANLKRIRDDLASYYLLGYNSTNPKFDGKFRAITVRVKRPGVVVRARRGYLAPTEEEAAARARAVAPPDLEADARTSALSSLGTERPDRPLRVAAGYGFGAGPSVPVLWIVGELDAATARAMEWSGGGEATITVTSEADGRTLATERAATTAVAPRFALNLPDAQLKPGDYFVKVRLLAKPTPTSDAIAQVRVTVPDLSGSKARMLAQPTFYRRGPYTGPGYQPTADTRFRKAERIRVDVPMVAGLEAPTARLLDRRGQPLSIPVTAGQREDGAARFATAEVVLAPLAPADYLIEVSVRRGEQTEKVVTAFRIVP
jgi:VWFA-related protein